MPIANGVVQLLMLLEKLLQKNHCFLKSCLHQLYLNKVITQLLHLVFVFTPAANLVTDEFSCKSQSDKFICQQDEFIFQRDEVAKRMNSIAKTCIVVNKPRQYAQYLSLFTATNMH